MKINFTPLAYKDITSVYEYIAKDDPFIAQKVLDQIESLIDHLPAYPKLGKKGRVKNTRELIVPSTPFIVVYNISQPFINILSIIHSAKRWKY